MIRRRLAMLALVPLLLSACSGGEEPVTPDVAASAPVGVTLPPGDLSDLVATPEEVPAGMVPIIQGSGPRSLEVVAGYSGTGAAATNAAAALRAHGFQSAYVAQYANQATGQVLSIVASRFADAAGATADFQADTQGSEGTVVAAETLGDTSTVTTRTINGSVASQLVLVRFRRGADTWALAYQAAPTADPLVAITLAKTILGRTTN